MFPGCDACPWGVSHPWYQPVLIRARARSNSSCWIGFWDTDFKGGQRLRRRTARKKHKASIKDFSDWIKQNRHRRLSHLMPQLKRKMVGYRNYFGLPDNSLSLARVNSHILHSLFKWLNRRSQRRSFNWQGFKDMLRYFQIKPMRVFHRTTAVDWYWESVLYTGKDKFEEPDAVIPHVRICVGSPR